MLSLYFHIPFCEKKCNYCNFFIIPKNKSFDYDELRDLYLNNLKKEILQKKEKFNLGKDKIYTIYFGGGTPSEFGINRIKEILLFVSKEFDISNLKEFSIELNPKLSGNENIYDFIYLISEFVRRLNSKARIRFSIGVQSINDEILNLSNRNYNFSYLTSFLEKLSIYNRNIFINLDFISFGLEMDLDKNYFMKFKEFVNSNLDFVDSYSVYTLELFPGSFWNNKFKTDEEKILNNFLSYLEVLKESSYLRYEISNFSKLGKESLHNLVYWNLGNYLGIGTSSSSFLKISNKFIRFTNTYSIKDYLNGKFDYKEYIELSYLEFMQEKLFLGLRKVNGIKFDKEFFDIIDKTKLDYYIKNKYMLLSNNKISLTSKGLNVYNYILSDLINF